MEKVFVYQSVDHFAISITFVSSLISHTCNLNPFDGPNRTVIHQHYRNLKSTNTWRYIFCGFTLIEVFVKCVSHQLDTSQQQIVIKREKRYISWFSRGVMLTCLNTWYNLICVKSVEWITQSAFCVYRILVSQYGTKWIYPNFFSTPFINLFSPMNQIIGV